MSEHRDQPGLSLLEFCKLAQSRIADSQAVLLVSHMFPEADSVGSEAAFARYLRRLGKRVYVRNPSEIQEIYRFLVDLSGLEPSAWQHGPDGIPEHDLLVLLDVSDWDYMGGLGQRLKEDPVPRIFFDHHEFDLPDGSLALIDPSASATGEVLYRFFTATGAEIDSEMASCLYASILFDTGCFRFRNTRDETLLIAADLIRKGASHKEIAARLFESESFPRLELLTAALSRLATAVEGRLAWTYVSEEIFRRTGTTAVDADGIVDHLMTVRGIEVGVLFREIQDGGIKVTFRSKGDLNVSDVAEALGGGGRPTAAGVTLKGSLDEVIARVLGELEVWMHRGASARDGMT